MLLTGQLRRPSLSRILLAMNVELPFTSTVYFPHSLLPTVGNCYTTVLFEDV